MRVDAARGHRAGTDDIGLSTEPANVFILGGSMVRGGVGDANLKDARARLEPLSSA